MLPFDGERYAWLLAPLGAACIVAAIILSSPLGLAIGTFGVLLLILACWSKREGFLLVGPFPRRELLRTIRRQRVHLWWSLAAAIVGAGIIGGYGAVFFNHLPRNTVSFGATMIFLFLAWNFFLIVFSVVVTTMSYAIAEDRDGKRLDFVLASDLRGREIVVGKYLGRLLTSLDYPFVLLPFLVLLPALFGIDSELMLFLAAFCLVSLLSISALGVLASTLAATKKAGGGVVTMFVLPYFLASFGLQALQHYPNVWFFPGSPSNVSRFCMGDAIEIFNAGNPILVAKAWFAPLAGGGMGALALDLRGYASFHIGLMLLALMIAARILRRQSARLADKPQSKSVKEAGAVPPVGNRPVFWKERYYAHAVVRARRNRFARLLGLLLLGLPILLFLAAAVDDLFGYAEKITEVARFYPVLLIWIFSVGGSRLGLESIVRERDKDTLTPLLLSDLAPREILREKFNGILRIFFPAWLAIGAVLAASVLCGATLPWIAAGGLILLVVFGTFFILLGLHSSVKATSLEAASKTFGWKMAPFAIVPPICLIAMISAPVVPPEDQRIGAIIVGGALVIYALLAWLFWHLAAKRFDEKCSPAADAAPTSPT